MMREAAKIPFSAEMAFLAGEGAKSLSCFTVAVLSGPPHKKFVDFIGLFTKIVARSPWSATIGVRFLFVNMWRSGWTSAELFALHTPPERPPKPTLCSTRPPVWSGALSDTHNPHDDENTPVFSPCP